MPNTNISKGSLMTITTASIVTVAGVAALMWFIAVPMAQNKLEQARPASSEAIKAAIDGSECMRRELERRVQGGLVVSNGLLESLQIPCKFNDEQLNALSS